MLLILKKLWHGYEYVIYDIADPRSKDWFLVSNPVTLAVILALYIYFSLKVGPFLMKNRKPFNLKTTLKIYNLMNVILSTCIFYEATVHIWFREYSFMCQGVSNSTDSNTMRVVKLAWWYYMGKLSELLDTVFFVLKKSDRQISFLHLYHHSMMTFASWIAVKYIPGGQALFVGWLNSFIHIFMYSYYLMSSSGPEYKKYLWWKPYLTVMQIVQFALVGIQNTVSLFYDCGFPTVLKLLLIGGAITFTSMFSSFYYYNYIKADENRKQEVKMSDTKIS